MLRLLRFLAFACASLALFTLPATVQAQSYPTRAITIIVPYPAGGPTDTVARFLASKLNNSFGVAVIVDNRPGAGGLLGTQYAARAEKDGHTLLLTTSIVINLVMFKEPGYRYEDLVPISTVSDSPMLLCVRFDLPVNNIREFVAFAKAWPGQLNAGVIGTAGTYQLLMGSLRENGDLDIVDVTYKGAADGLRDLISRQIDMFFTDPLNAVAQFRDGKIKILATASKAKVAGLDVPTMDEVGIPLEGGTVQTGLYAPAGTPPAAISRLNSELVRIIATPEYQNMLSRFGTIPVSSSAEEFDRQLREQSKKWTELKVKMKLEAQ